jgi:hypothetical protein
MTGGHNVLDGINVTRRHDKRIKHGWKYGDHFQSRLQSLAALVIVD